MLYECRHCGQSKAFGCLPTVSCGAFLGVTAGLSLGSILLTAQALIDAYGLAKATIYLLTGLLIVTLPVFFWNWRHAKVVALALELTLLDILAALAIAPYAILQLVEFLFVFLTRCSYCGCRRWSWGKTSGFGL